MFCLLFYCHFVTSVEFNLENCQHCDISKKPRKICDTNGNTYSSECEWKITVCHKNQTEIGTTEIAYVGNCKCPLQCSRNEDIL